MPVPAGDGGTRRYSVLWIAVLLLTAWMLYPILTPTHVEGFSASIVSLALHLDAGRLADYDRLHPANLEYFTLSRLGAVTWLSALVGPLRLSGEWAMRVTMWLGFAVLATASFLLVRAWTNASSMMVVVVLLLIPGLAENAFFYNDTVFAAALGVSALAVVRLRPGVVGAAVGGILFGSAIVARLDAVLLGPGILLVGHGQHGLGRPFWSRASIFAVGAALPIVLVPAVMHATILDIAATTRYAVGLWGNGFRPAQHAREVSLFIGIPAGVLIALGCVGLARRGEYRRAALLVGVPVVFNLVALGKIWQSRQLLPMTPFFAALAILGWQHVLLETQRSDGRGTLRLTVGGLCALAWLAPVVFVVPSDGPRAPYGRLWTPPLWRRWQSAVRSNFAELRSLAVLSGPDSTAVITDTWDADRYLHLTLQETGYQQTPGPSAYASCTRTTEEFARGSRRLLHIRLHQPFLPNWRELAAARLDTWGRPCLEKWKPSRLTWLAPIGQVRSPALGAVSPELPAARERALRIMAEAHYSPQVSVDISSTALDLLRDTYLAGDEQRSTRTLSEASAEVLAEAERRMAPRVWKSPPAP